MWPLTVSSSYLTEDALAKATSMEPLTVSMRLFCSGPRKARRTEPLTVEALVGLYLSHAGKKFRSFSARPRGAVTRAIPGRNPAL